MGNNWGEKPFIFSSEENYAKYSSSPSTFTVDALERQIKELFFIDNPSFIGESKEKIYSTNEFLSYKKSFEEKFTYVYYPWNHHLVKTVKEDDYFRLITNRNKDLITAEEQEKLYNYKVAVFGMSVGSNIAFVMTQAGISKDIVIADFDDLDTTNLNRIFAGVHQIGLNKTTVAAQKIYEANPFANVTMLNEGVSKENCEELLKTSKINCIVEEVDSVPVKIQIRQLAYQYKVPVIMITDNGDGIVIHVERYDRNYAKVFDKSFEYWDEKIKNIKSKSDVGEMIVTDILGGPQNISPRVFQSVERVMKKELVSWAQLGSAALLGGVTATIAIKNIVLDKMKDDYVESNIQLLS